MSGLAKEAEKSHATTPSTHNRRWSNPFFAPSMCEYYSIIFQELRDLLIGETDKTT